MFPMSAQQNEFPMLGSRQRLYSHSSWPLRFCREGVAHRVMLNRASHRGASLHADADQASQNLRRPSGDRHRERAVVQRTAGAQCGIARSLEHQTATAEVLGIISRSPTDVQPVLDAIVESAARVCGIDDVVLRLREGDSYGCAGSFWSRYPYLLAASRSVLMSHSFAGCASMARSTFPTSDAQNDFPRLGIAGGFRTFLAAPLRQQGEFIGTLDARRIEVRPFTPAQIKLLETFADQA